MNSHRQLKKAKLSDLQEQREKITKKAMNTCRMIMPLIDPALSEIVDMDIASAADAMEELVMHQAELLGMKTKIAELEEALYG